MSSTNGVGLQHVSIGGFSDKAALLRARISAEEEEQKRLLAECVKLQQEVEMGASKTVGAFCPAGCSEIVPRGTDSSDERFALLVAFQHHAPMSGVAVSKEDIVSAASWGRSALFFDMPRWHKVAEVEGIAAGSPNGSFNSITPYVATSFVPTMPGRVGLATGHQVQLWKYDSEPNQQHAFEHQALVGALDFHGAQHVLASATDTGQVHAWDIEEQRVLRTLPCGAELTGCKFAGSTDTYQFLIAASGLDGTACIWDIRSPTRVRCEVTDAATCITCHSGCHTLAVGSSDGQLCTWDMRTWRELQRFDTQEHAGAYAYPKSIAMSPCGTFLASGGMDGELLIYQVHGTSRVFQIHHHRDAIGSVAWGGCIPWASAQHFLTCASLDGSWSCWAHGLHPVHHTP